ncbi:MAG: hypothetical protein IPH03_06965 [Tetrasphaera sp.]|nr:hypothetical protein [Tetrasphaera sp.]
MTAPHPRPGRMPIHARRRRAAVALVLAAAATTACSSSAHPATTTVTVTVTAGPSQQPSAPVESPSDSLTGSLPPALDPCSLLDHGLAEQVAAVPLGKGTVAGNAPDLMCQYVSDPNGPTGQVEVFVGSGPKKQLEIDRDVLGHDFTTIAGVADECLLEPGYVFVRKGEQWVSVNVVALTPSEEHVQKGLVTMAKAIAAKL